MPRPFFRFVLISATLLFFSALLLGASSHGPPLSKTLKGTATKAHDKLFPHSTGSHAPLEPFPVTPMVSLAEGDEGRGGDRMQMPWLAAVISPAYDIERRMMIRSTWMQMYADVPFDARFVVSNPGPKWTEAVRFENRTYGDIIVLDHIPENRFTANSIKTLEFYKWLLKSGRRYEFVSKIDTDLWFNARGFWHRYIEPRLTNTTTSPSSEASMKATVERTAIGQLYYSRPYHRAFPHGSMYTHTWDLIELLVTLQERNPVVMGEDQAVTKLLHDAGEQANLVNMNTAEKFDYDDADSRTADSAWARAATHPTATLHALYGSDVLAVHQLKDRDLFMKVATCFDSAGIKTAPRLKGPEKTPPFFTRLHDFLDSLGWSTHFEGQLERIPSWLYHQEGDDWIVNDVWNLGPDKSGFQKGEKE
ncbi:hypothetical protein CC79DRAFT_1360536 [Sarocladium strictum]